MSGRCGEDGERLQEVLLDKVYPGFKGGSEKRLMGKKQCRREREAAGRVGAGGGEPRSPLPLLPYSGLEGHKGHSQELRKWWVVPRASILQFSMRSTGTCMGQSCGHKTV